MVAVKFSIVVPVYNVAQYLRECLDSIVAQGCQDWECICVDDGSTDDSGAILDEYAARDHRFVVVHQANAGVSAARNRGMDEAKGDYLLFVDGDDTCVPWMLEDLLRAVELEPDADFIKFGAQNVVGMSEALPERLLVDERTIRAIQIDTDVAARDAYQNVKSVMLAWGGCHKRSSVTAVRFKNYPNGEDELFAFDALMNARCIVLYQGCLYRYRLPRSGSANSMTLKNMRSCCAVFMNEYRVKLSNWRYGSVVKNVDARKNRTVLYAIQYKIMQNVSLEDQEEAWRVFKNYLKDFVRLWPDGLPCWDMFVLRLAVRTRMWWMVWLLGWLPFSCYVYVRMMLNAISHKEVK